MTTALLHRGGCRLGHRFVDGRYRDVFCHRLWTIGETTMYLTAVVTFIIAAALWVDKCSYNAGAF